jgi:hypothetical protein
VRPVRFVSCIFKFSNLFIIGYIHRRHSLQVHAFALGDVEAAGGALLHAPRAGLAQHVAAVERRVLAPLQTDAAREVVGGEVLGSGRLSLFQRFSCAVPPQLDLRDEGPKLVQGTPPQRLGVPPQPPHASGSVCGVSDSVRGDLLEGFSSRLGGFRARLRGFDAELRAANSTPSPHAPHRGGGDGGGGGGGGRGEHLLLQELLLERVHWVRVERHRGVLHSLGEGHEAWWVGVWRCGRAGEWRCENVWRPERVERLRRGGAGGADGAVVAPGEPAASRPGDSVVLLLLLSMLLLLVVVVVVPPEVVPDAGGTDDDGAPDTAGRVGGGGVGVVDIALLTVPM